MAEPHFDRIALIGIGLIGSSLARVIRREGLAGHVAISTRSAGTLARAEELGLGDSYSTDPAIAVRDADLVIVSVPVGASGDVADAIALGRARTVLDLAGVGFCDSVGVSVLLQARQRAQRAGTVLVMRGVRATVVRVLDIAGLTAVLPVDGGREGVRSAAT